MEINRKRSRFLHIRDAIGGNAPSVIMIFNHNHEYSKFLQGFKRSLITWIRFVLRFLIRWSCTKIILAYNKLQVVQPFSITANITFQQFNSRQNILRHQNTPSYTITYQNKIFLPQNSVSSCSLYSKPHSSPLIYPRLRSSTEPCFVLVTDNELAQPEFHFYKQFYSFAFNCFGCISFNSLHWFHFS